MNSQTLKSIGWRFFAAAMSLVFVIVTVFAITNVLPGDATDAVLGQGATPQAVAVMRHDLGLDRPVFFRFWFWLWGVLHGDFGHSLLNGLSVADAIGPRLHTRYCLRAPLLRFPFLSRSFWASRLPSGKTRSMIVSYRL